MRKPDSRWNSPVLLLSEYVTKGSVALFSCHEGDTRLLHYQESPVFWPVLWSSSVVPKQWESCNTFFSSFSSGTRFIFGGFGHSYLSRSLGFQQDWVELDTEIEGCSRNPISVNIDLDGSYP